MTTQGIPPPAPIVHRLSPGLTTLVFVAVGPAVAGLAIILALMAGEGEPTLRFFKSGTEFWTFLIGIYAFGLIPAIGAALAVARASRGRIDEPRYLVAVSVLAGGLATAAFVLAVVLLREVVAAGGLAGLGRISLVTGVLLPVVILGVIGSLCGLVCGGIVAAIRMRLRWGIGRPSKPS